MSRPAVQFASVADFGLAPSADVLTRAFSGYFVPIAFTPTSLLASARIDGVDHTLSRVAISDAEPIGAALIARRGWTSRLAGMAVVPAARGRGVARALVEQLLVDAQARGDRAMELEVIEQNKGAVSLYEACGFRATRRLIGYEGKVTVDATCARELEEVDIAELARLVTIHGLPDLPWQVGAPTLARLGPPHVALRSGASHVLITDPSAPTISIRALLTDSAQRRDGHATTLLRALFARYPGKGWRVGALCPQELGDVFVRAGLAPSPLRQWQMRKSLG